MPDLKNIRQIGSMSETEKIYITSRAYACVTREEFAERRVFVLMGHTECEQAGYATFVEDVIPVRGIAFSQGVPVWNNRVWSEVLGAVRRSFEDLVIVGWALDIVGMPPRLTTAVEAAHREHFGGAHQLLLLIDSAEQEMHFYRDRLGYFGQKSGFYIYDDEKSRERELPDDDVCEREEKEAPGVREEKLYRKAEPFDKAARTAETREIMERRRLRENRRMRENRTVEEDMVIIDCGPDGEMPRARYRELMAKTAPRRTQDSGKRFSTAAVAVAVLLLAAIIGTGIRQGRFSFDGIGQAVETIQTTVLKRTVDESAEDAAKQAEEGADAEDVSAVLRSIETAEEIPE